MMQGSGQISVPPGFRFHPTDEELLYYYLRKKVSYEAIDLDVIREVDLNKLEPWDLKEKCRIGSGPQNEWYFFSHKDKKYPTGTRTNRATTAGFWKATGRDKAIYLSNSKRIGMRKTLVFYTGRAPHGQKTDWIMHEYRLEEDDAEVQEDGWVVCRVFKKKNLNRGFQPEMEELDHHHHHHHHNNNEHLIISGSSSNNNCLHHHQVLEPKHHHHTTNNIHHLHHNLHHQALLYDHHHNNNFDGSMHLPQLFSPESCMNPMDVVLDCAASQNLLRLTSTSTTTTTTPTTTPSSNNNNTTSGGGGLISNLLHPQGHDNHHHQRMGSGTNGGGGDWSFLDKLLASSQPQQVQPGGGAMGGASSSSSLNHKFPFHYLGCDQIDIMKFSK